MCKACGASYSGRTRDDLCPVCEAKDRHRVYGDPGTPAEWYLRQCMRLAQLQRMHTDGKGAPVHFTKHDKVGLCAMCGKRLDDHALMYAPLQQYAIGLCAKQDMPTPEMPRNLDDYGWA